MPKRPIIAAIPNYNMASSLEALLPQVLAQGYNAVYLLDDHSTDNSIEVARRFDGVQVICGEENRGASGNRNRILEVKKQWPTAIIHFIDADTELVSTHNPTTLDRLLADPTIGILGGLVYGPNGLQSSFNFGPRVSLMGLFGVIKQGLILARVLTFGLHQPLRPPKPNKVWPDIGAKPMSQDTYYVLEGNMAMRMETLVAIGGFHPTMRDSEAQELSDRITAAGPHTLRSIYRLKTLSDTCPRCSS